MGGFEVAVMGVTSIAVAGCLTAIVLTVTDKIFDKRKTALQMELERARDRIQMLEGRITDLQTHNEQLARTQEWTNRLLEAEARKELASGR